MSARLESEGRTGEPRRVAIVDFGMGNLFSVEQACLAVGLAPSVTKDRRAVEGADIVILPGVGAFGDAMENLRSRDLIGPLRDVAASGRLLIGICLGLQMLMDESEEFGAHKGLGLVSGTVLRLAPTRAGAKVPQIGWNRVYEARPGAWADTPFEGQRDSVYMYFVHSYYVTPADTRICHLHDQLRGRDLLLGLARRFGPCLPIPSRAQRSRRFECLPRDRASRRHIYPCLKVPS